MPLSRCVIQLPPKMLAHLREKRRDGYTISGYIRALLERDIGDVTHNEQVLVRKEVEVARLSQARDGLVKHLTQPAGLITAHGESKNGRD